MSTARNIKGDRGLTVRMFTTGLLLVLLYGAVVGILIAVGISYVVVLVIAAALLFCQYWFSDKIALFGMGGHIVTPQQAPELHGVIDRLCALADMDKPRVAIAPGPMMNAFATGRNSKNSVLCVTEPMLKRLEPAELEGVLAHELSHVAHKDVQVMTYASLLAIVAGLLVRFAFYSELFGGGGRRDSNNQNAFPVILAIMVVSAVVYAISFLLIRVLSRYRELAADRSGALLTGQPSALASALQKVSGDMSRIPTEDLRAAAPLNALAFAPALNLRDPRASLAKLFSTHPTLERRLEELEKIQAQLGQVSPGPRAL